MGTWGAGREGEVLSPPESRGWELAPCWLEDLEPVKLYLLPNLGAFSAIISKKFCFSVAFFPLHRG